MNKDLIGKLAKIGFATYTGAKVADNFSKTLLYGKNLAKNDVQRKGLGKEKLRAICQKEKCDLDDWEDVFNKAKLKELIQLCKTARDIELLYHFAFNCKSYEGAFFKKLRHHIVENPAFLNDMMARLLAHIAPFDVTHKKWKRLDKHPEEYDAKLEKKLRNILKGITDYENPDLQTNPLQ